MRAIYSWTCFNFTLGAIANFSPKLGVLNHFIKLCGKVVVRLSGILTGIRFMIQRHVDINSAEVIYNVHFYLFKIRKGRI
jgi:hypothetical protein